jgi:aminoglycoside phosphotransferase (APT) family kinase protein
MKETTNMELNRADASAIDAKSRAEALSYFGIDENAWLAKGTEAEVFSLSDSHVLKLYADPSRAGKLKVLKDFYASLEAEDIGYALPRIYDIVQLHGLLAVKERRIEGSALADSLPALGATARVEARRSYLEAVVKLGDVRTTYVQTRYKLFDEAGHSATESRDWHQFIYELAKLKLDRQRAALMLDVADLSGKERQLRELCLARSFRGPRRVVHGDFFPGNVLADDTFRVQGVIDFGSFTMFGDALYDVALACIFFDMYGPDRTTVRDEMVELALRRLGPEVEGTLYRYAMAYAFMSCDLYAAPHALREDDHYKWAVELLNTDRYWQRMG